MNSDFILLMVSYFLAPISNTLALKNISLREIYELIATDFLKKWTDQVRAGTASKSKVLPYVTFSAICKKRHMDYFISYTGLICIDLDKVDIRWLIILAGDKILNPVLAFISPSGNGIKLVIRINGGTRENHLAHFNAICHYLFITYGLKADPSGSDICRATFLCMDAGACFNEEGSVDSETLLSFLPTSAAPGTDARLSVDKDARLCVSTPRYVSTSTSVPSFGNPTYSAGERPSEKLNRMPEIHAMAVRALQTYGWQQNQNEDLWTRPKKEVRQGCSAIYNLHPTEGIWFLTCFTSSDPVFKCHRGYTDVQIINLLCYDDNWSACIADLASRYLEPAY